MNKTLKIGTILLCGLSLVACGESTGGGTYEIPYQTGALTPTTENQKIVDIIDEVYGKEGESVADASKLITEQATSFGVDHNMTYSAYSYTRSLEDGKPSETTGYFMVGMKDANNNYFYFSTDGSSTESSESSDEEDYHSTYEFIYKDGKGYKRNEGDSEEKEIGDASSSWAGLMTLIAVQAQYSMAYKYADKVEYNESSKSYGYHEKGDTAKLDVTFKFNDGRLSYAFYSSYSEDVENVFSIAFYNYDATVVPAV